jgi:hypothetical protein
LPRGSNIIGHVAETGMPFVTNHVHAVLFYEPTPLLPDTESELTVPIKRHFKKPACTEICRGPCSRSRPYVHSCFRPNGSPLRVNCWLRSRTN